MIDSGVGFHGTVRCLRCGRPLRAAASVARRYGAHCWSRIRGAVGRVLAEGRFKRYLVDKAEELISIGGIVRINWARPIFTAVASHGDATYLTHPRGCTCKCGLRGKHACHHRIAAVILAAA